MAAGWRRIALADPMRDLLRAIDPLVIGGVRLAELIDRHGWDAAKREFPEVRRLLIACGEGGRAVLGPDCWLLAAEQTDEWQSEEPLVVSDIRPHAGEHLTIEVDWIHEHGGQVIRIDRPRLTHAVRHYTEAVELLEPDAVLVNDGTVEELQAAVLRAVGEVLGC